MFLTWNRKILNVLRRLSPHPPPPPVLPSLLKLTRCIMRCSVVIPSTELLVDGRADYAAVAGRRRLFFWAADVVVVAHCRR